MANIQEKLAKKLAKKLADKRKEVSETSSDVSVQNYTGEGLKGKAGSGNY